MFSLDPRLAADTLPIGELPLSRVLLMNDSQYPWLILVPRRPDIAEPFELELADSAQLAVESCFVARVLSELFPGAKLNVAALGNIVRQLHVHHVARFPQDATWPAPIWGRLPPKPYAPDQARERVLAIRDAMRAQLLPE